MFDDVKDQVIQKVDQASKTIKGKFKPNILDQKDSDTCPATFKTEYRTVLTAYRHVVKDWIEKFPSKDAKEYRFLLELSSTEFDRLNKFASSSIYEAKDVLHEVHVISDLLKNTVYKIEEDKPTFSGLTWSTWLRSFDVNVIIKTALVTILIGTISFISIRTHLRRGRWFTTFFIVAFIVSFVQNWLTLYQEAQAKIDEVLMKKLPKHCQGHPMGILDSVKVMLGRFVQIPVSECLEYHKALRATPHAQVTPVQALSMTFAQLFTTPLGKIGEALSQFFAGTMAHVPIVLWPVIIVLIIFVVIVAILMYSRYEVHLPFMMGSLRPSSHVPIAQKDNHVEQLENSLTDSKNQIQELENKVKQLQVELEQKTLAIEHPTTNSSTRPSRAFSIERTDQERERSVSSSRSIMNKENKNPPQQPTKSPHIGFKPEFFPD